VPGASSTRYADALLDAFATGRLTGLPSDGDPELDVDGAYAIASEIHERRIARGERPVGRKIGFTNREIWAEYGVSEPIWSHVYDSTVQYAEGGIADVSIGKLLQPRIEPEIQLHFARTPPVLLDEAAILACVDWIAQGFEIVQCPYPDWKFRSVDAIAASGLHGALVVGTPVPVSDIEEWRRRLRTFTITCGDGDQAVAGGGANVLDSPVVAFGHLALVLSRQSRFEPVRAGEIITTGTLTRPVPVARGETWSTSLEGIDLPGLSTTLT
jgi:2-oxo-3-hexenedioate decarboxylase